MTTKFKVPKHARIITTGDDFWLAYIGRLLVVAERGSKAEIIKKAEAWGWTPARGDRSKDPWRYGSKMVSA